MEALERVLAPSLGWQRAALAVGSTKIEKAAKRPDVPGLDARGSS